MSEDSLKHYREKRNFAVTPEPRPPAGVQENASGEHIFVVQKHDARNLHYDFRLEIDGFLKSWAVPKGPSLDPADKRLAVMTEDHPLEYATFEGGIAEGEYGGGTVMVWDFGWWEPDVAWMEKAKGGGPTDPEAALAAGDLKFIIHGQKLTGSWALVQMKGRGEKNWLLLKHRDEAARPGAIIITEAPDSVATGRSLDQIAADETG
jgi:bifunctional non-homologous end joining protein LigD